jgi:hypothetical protein
MDPELTTLVSADENQIIYRTPGQLPPFYTNKFRVFDSKTGEPKIVKVDNVTYKGATGLTVNFIVKDGFMYELFLFKGSQTKEATYNGMIRRDLKTLKQVGDLVIVDKIDEAYYLAAQDFELIRGEQCFYLIAGAEHVKKHYIKKFNYQLEEQWTKELDFLDVKGAKVAKINVDESDNALLTLLFTETPKSSFFTFKSPAASSSTLAFLHFNKNGEASAIMPQFETSLNVRAYDFKIYEEEKLLVGIFSTTKVVDESKNLTGGLGYAYMVWDFEGNLLRSKNHYLTYDDMNGKELQKRLINQKIQHKNPIEKGKELPTINMYQNFNAFFQPDGSILITHIDFVPAYSNSKEYGFSYYSSNLVYNISNEGELVWTKFFARDEGFNNYNPQEYIVKDGNLHMYVKMHIGEITSDEIELLQHAEKHVKDGKSVLVLERVIDVKSGDIIKFKPLLNEPIIKATRINYYTLDDKLVFSFANSKTTNLVLITR